MQKPNFSQQKGKVFLQKHQTQMKVSVRQLEAQERLSVNVNVYAKKETQKKKQKQLDSPLLDHFHRIGVKKADFFWHEFDLRWLENAFVRCYLQMPLLANSGKSLNETLRKTV